MPAVLMPYMPAAAFPISPFFIWQATLIGSMKDKHTLMFQGFFEHENNL
jgi:hypothetical protein